MKRISMYALPKRSHTLLTMVRVLTIVSVIWLQSVWCVAQTQEFKQFDARSIFGQLDTNATSQQQTLVAPWWEQHVSDSLRPQKPIPADIHTLLFLAVRHSNNIKIAKRDPLIRETAIQEADSNFDWIRYLNSAWNDTSEPTSSSLTAGSGVNRFNDHVLQGTAGVRRLTRYGGQLDISQRFGWQDNNSNFFIPGDQATGQFTVSYTHPLLRGNGFRYNNAVVFLAQIDSEVAEQEFLATLQDELLEVTRAYWALYLERSTLAHQMRLFLKTNQIFEALKARQAVDTQRTQLITAASALENRRADLIRARTAVTNAETRLRGLINAPELENTVLAELIPIERPVVLKYDADLQTELQIGIQNRPEVRVAIQQIRAAAERVGVAENDLLPVLNLVTQGFTSGLRGSSNFGGAFVDQFSEGAPSYSLGVQYELPVGNRLAGARLCRRKLELARLNDEYARALEAIQTEVDIAVRELNTAYLEIGAKSRALLAAEAEADTIEERWLKMADGSGSSGLNLESLLRAQERVTDAERDYVTSVLTYNLGMVNLKRSNGTLLQNENVVVEKSNDGFCNDLVVHKTGPSQSRQAAMQSQNIQFSQQEIQIPQQSFPTQSFPAQSVDNNSFPADLQILPTQQSIPLKSISSEIYPLQSLPPQTQFRN